MTRPAQLPEPREAVRERQDGGYAVPILAEPDERVDREAKARDTLDRLSGASLI
jgi:monomeric isocitrate dehydrogenase